MKRPEGRAGVRGCASAEKSALYAEISAAPPPVNIPPHHRVNFSVSGAHHGFVGSLTVSYTDRAFWTDVLAIQGWTDRFWLVSATGGLNFKGDRVTWSIKGTNLTDRAPHLRRSHSPTRHDRTTIQTLSRT